MRVALIVPGGVDRSGRFRVIPVLLALIKRLARRHEVVVITLHQEPQPCEYSLFGARIINLGDCPGTTPLRTIKRIWRSLSVLRAIGPFDLLHAFWVHEPGTIAIACSRVLKTPCIVSIGGGELVWLPEITYGGQRRKIDRARNWIVLSAAAAVTAGSNYSLAPLKRIRPDAMPVVLGVEDFPATDAVETSNGPPWRLLHVAGLNKVKDQATLVQAVRFVIDAGCPVQLDCFGPDTLKGKVHDLAGRLNLNGVVKFHGFRPLDEIVPFYRAAHLYLQSSLHESMGASVLEAAKAGVPTVGTSVGLVAQLAPQAAVAVPLRDPSLMADQIVRLLKDTPRRSSLGAAARDFAISHDPDWTCARFEEIYFRVVHQVS